MGVRGLHSYLEDSQTGQVYDLTFYGTNSGKKETLVVDGLGLIRKLYHPKINWVNGGDFNDLLESTRTFVNDFARHGFELVIFFDGGTEEIKMNEYFRRKIRDLKRISDALTFVSEHQSQPTELFIPPLIIRDALVKCFQSLGCQIYYSIGEADREMAMYCKTHNCFGVLGFDSDFFLFDIPRYLCSEHLELSPTQLRVLIFLKPDILKHFNFTCVEELMLLGCLAGNDYVEQNQLDEFHLFVTNGGPVFDHRWQLIEKIARFISKTKNENFNWHPQEFHVDQFLSKTPIIKDSPHLLSFLIDAFVQYRNLPRDEIITKFSPRDLTSENMPLFEKVFHFLHSGILSPHLLGILTKNYYMRGYCLRDNDREHCLISTQPIRHCIYRLIFASPEEMLQIPSHQNPYFEDLTPHFQKIKGQTSTIIFERMGINRWTLFNPASIKVDIDKNIPNFLLCWEIPLIFRFGLFMTSLKIIPSSPIWGLWLHPRTLLEEDRDQYLPLLSKLSVYSNSKFFSSDVLVFISIILSFLFCNKKISLFETEVLLCQAILCATKTKYHLPPVSELVISKQAIHIATLYLRTSEDLLLLNNACGNPLDIDGPWRYFNGTFTQYCCNLMPQSLEVGDKDKEFPRRMTYLSEFKLASQLFESDFPELYNLACLLRPAIFLFTVLPYGNRTDFLSQNFETILQATLDNQNLTYLEDIESKWKRFS